MTELTHPTTGIRKDKSKENYFIAIFMTILCISLLGIIFFDIVNVSGNHLDPYPGEDLMTDYIFGILWASILGISILFWPVSSEDRKALLRIWLIKAFVVLFLMLAYEYQYHLDPDGYFTNAIASDFTFEGFEFGNGTTTMQQLTWLLLKIVPGSYHAAKVSCAMMALLGIYLYYRAAVIFLDRKDVRILYVFALFPGILFWSSILGKDPIIFLGFSFYTYGIIAFHRLGHARYLPMVALGILVGSLIRLWLVPMMIVPLLVFSIAGGRIGNRLWLLGFAVICMVAFSSPITMLGDLWGLTSTADFFSFRTYAVGAFREGGSSIEIPDIEGVDDAVRSLPFGIFTALFRPLPFEVLNLFGFLQGLENVVLLYLLGLAAKRTKLKDLNSPIILWAISSVLIYAAFYGLVVYNLGALVRYKLQVYPILLGLLLYLGRRRAGSAIAG